MPLIAVFASFLVALFDEALSRQAQFSHAGQPWAEACTTGASAAEASAVIIAALKLNPASTHSRTAFVIASSGTYRVSGSTSDGSRPVLEAAAALHSGYPQEVVVAVIFAAVLLHS